MSANHDAPLFDVSKLSACRNRTSPAFKRPFDLALASLFLVLLTPAMLLIALMIKLTSSGAVLFRQERVGQNGELFTMYKFRSMYSDADNRLAELKKHSERSGHCFKMRRDPRITPLGRFMRRSSVDELPQLLNVLLGDMSLVGPRPALPSEVAGYSAHECRRLAALPGITGLWQVSGRADLSFDEMIRLDLIYIRDCSLITDIRLLIATVSAVVTARGAY